MAALLFHSSASSVFSSRNIGEACRDRLSFRFATGNLVPDRVASEVAGKPAKKYACRQNQDQYADRCDNQALWRRGKRQQPVELRPDFLGCGNRIPVWAGRPI